ncbi:hypothetical protein LTR10_020457 [Elasticomyces elasticus]|uniref:Uncharacterized protein n=1 Tax=Exophiala sideris TaxID=1016849 RepID=A0ABR0J5I9_9EURO|nr:hypothetical protein LTR10_020457 [Elasticomyces elasticus]KAK5027017.1 hypothetical protein LTS07_007316 [Exophiala sideris]KAK5034021.1 hypothetical protein LTR13_006621 [Exophiala sideris]KAK5055704.1 hypothetical protein LTR69_008079 [Exophiala sideris]KAK5180963.1 hypothetical protein LTR44_006783 [Eurotiomycetes sp. CCFEE 6388]
MSESKLVKHGFSFHNWPGAGEAAAEYFGLSHAVIVPPNIRTVLVGGQVGIRDDESVPKDLTEEVLECFDHIERSMKAAGMGDDCWELVYKIHAFHVYTDGLDEAIAVARKKYLKNTKPSWTGVFVKKLFRPELRIEISVEAYFPQ